MQFISCNMALDNCCRYDWERLLVAPMKLSMYIFTIVYVFVVYFWECSCDCHCTCGVLSYVVVCVLDGVKRPVLCLLQFQLQCKMGKVILNIPFTSCQVLEFQPVLSIVSSVGVLDIM